MCGRAHLLHACLIKLICVLVSALSCMHAHELARLPARVLSDSRARVILQRYAFALISHTLTLCPHPRLRMHTARVRTLHAASRLAHATCTLHSAVRSLRLLALAHPLFQGPPGMGSPVAHLHRDWAGPDHTSALTRCCLDGQGAHRRSESAARGAAGTQRRLDLPHA
jgi:hypothetical protein